MKNGASSKTNNPKNGKTQSNSTKLSATPTQTPSDYTEPCSYTKTQHLSQKPIYELTNKKAFTAYLTKNAKECAVYEPSAT